MRETEDFYFFWRHQFGQWTLRQMTDPDGVNYNCCEQYMMYKKARLFADQATAEAILAEPDPACQQQLGRQVKGFSAALWQQHRVGIVWYGNYLKFSQHADLLHRLLATEHKILAEASPDDRIWGVGLAAENDAILEPDNWTGQNLLGNILMSVRSALGANSS